MPNLPLEPEGEEQCLRREDNENHIELPPKIFSSPIRIDKIEESAKAWLEQYNFYFSRFSLSASVDTSARGVKWLSIKGNVIGLVGGERMPVNLDDKGPKTEWVKGDSKTEFNIEVNFNPLSSAFQIINIPNPISGGLNYTWHRDPKIGKVILQGAGATIGWTFKA